MKFLGVDFGLRKTGLAIADAEVRIAIPLKVIMQSEIKKTAQEIAEIMSKEGIETVIVGLPISRQGSDSQQTKEARNFIETLKHLVGPKITVVIEDERLSTKMSKKLLSEVKKGPDDAVAAAVLLQGFLDRTNQ